MTGKETLFEDAHQHQWVAGYCEECGKRERHAVSDERQPSSRSLVEEARYTADTLAGPAGPAGNAPPIVRVLREIADACDLMAAPLREIAVAVVLAEDLSEQEQIAALWAVVRRHATIAQEVLRV